MRPKPLWLVVKPQPSLMTVLPGEAGGLPGCAELNPFPENQLLWEDFFTPLFFFLFFFLAKIALIALVLTEV